MEKWFHLVDMEWLDNSLDTFQRIYNQLHSEDVQTIVENEHKCGNYKAGRMIESILSISVEEEIRNTDTYFSVLNRKLKKSI